MVLFKELSLTIFLLVLLAPAFQVWAQPACTSHFLPNSTVDIKQYNNIGLHIVKTLTTSGHTGMTDCSLQCCETGNCSLVVFTDAESKCLLIHCVTKEACSPIPSNTSQLIQSIRNNETFSADILALNNTWNATENITVSSALNITGMNMSTGFPENTSISMNDTDVSLSSDLNITLSNSTDNSTNLISNDTITSTDMISDNITMENTTGLNASDALESSNGTSSEESFGTMDNSTGTIQSNSTGEVGEPVTETIFLPPTTPDANMTLENGNKSLSMNSSLTTLLPAVLIDSNSTWDNSTNGTHASFNTNGHLSSVNNTAKEEADSSEEGAEIIGDHSMMVILVATLSIGMLLFIAIVAVVSKKAVDGWQRRHYSRIDYLVNGMYN